jgi:hypothetical protein
MRTVRITVTTMDGEVLDMATVEMPEGNRGIAYRPCLNGSIGPRGDEEVLDIGEKDP